MAQAAEFKSIKNSDEMICLLWENVPFSFVLDGNVARKAHCAATSDRIRRITRSISCSVVEDAKACVQGCSLTLRVKPQIYKKRTKSSEKASKKAKKTLKKLN